MPSNRKQRLGVLLIATMVMPAWGCVDYTNRFDTVNIHAGDAKDSNIAIQTIDPWPRSSERTYVDHSGQKISGAITKYAKPQSAQ